MLRERFELLSKRRLVLDGQLFYQLACLVGLFVQLGSQLLHAAGSLLFELGYASFQLVRELAVLPIASGYPVPQELILAAEMLGLGGALPMGQLLHL